MKSTALLVLTLNLGFLSRSADSIEGQWFPRVDGISIKGEFIDLNKNAAERLYIRYRPIADQGVELEMTTNNAVAWRVYVRPLGVKHSKYHHDVHVRIEGDKVFVTSIGARQIFEVRSLKTGALISRDISDVQR
jgi:hypothetical protein